jgi:hypothetical protein
MNHELNDQSGVVRRHGQIGAFVSEWSIDRKSFKVTAGRDLIDPGVQYWNYATGSYSLSPSLGFGAAFDRFCSNTLTEPGQLFNAETGRGFDGQLFLAGEENCDIGRGFALTTTGEIAQLPRMGLFSYENTVPAHNRGDTTLVVGNEDAEDGQLWVYWDPASPNDYYFVTTEGGEGAATPTGRFGRDGGGLWRLPFDDIERPERGGTLPLLLDGSEPPFLNKPDNMAIDRGGNLLIQEDPGNNVGLARIVAYRIADGAHGVLARFDPALFGWRGGRLPNGNPVLEPGQLTFDEESSGIIDAHAVIGPRWFLFDVQVHRAESDRELVQGSCWRSTSTSGRTCTTSRRRRAEP